MSGNRDGAGAPDLGRGMCYASLRFTYGMRTQ